MSINGITIGTVRPLEKAKKQTNQNEAFTFKAQLQADTFNGKSLKPAKPSLLEMALEFTGRKGKKRRKSSDHHEHNGVRLTLPPGPHGVAGGQYRNLFDTTLKATPNPNLDKELSQDKSIYNVGKASVRLASLSRYLKEDMVGFITPSGHHWFPGALENIIHGAQAKKVPEDRMQGVAKEFWGLLAKADPYWSSKEFVKYLESMPEAPARNATLAAVKEIHLERTVPRFDKVAFGYKSELKDVPKILQDGGCYTGTPMQRSGGGAQRMASAEHIFPHSKGGPDNDFNFMVATAKANSDRGNMPLIDFLKGRSVYD